MARTVRRGFTLVETLVVMGIVAVLLSVLLPVLDGARKQMRALKCLSNLRSVSFKFQLFAEGNNAEGRGKNSATLGPARFQANDFQETLYRIDEFWDLGRAATGSLNASDEPMLCPAGGAAQLTRRRGFPCGQQALGPTENVSLAMNMRLFRAAQRSGSATVLAPEGSTQIPADILSHPYVPVMMDVDGRTALARRLQPFYMAPPLPGRADAAPYANGSFWMPSDRHRGHMNVAFVGGHVLSSARPEQESWDWSYQAQVGR